MSNNFDALVIGAGPSGSTTATLLAKKGHKVALLEKENFPRFRIGESLLPASMPILEESGALPRIESGNYLIKHGARFMDYRSDGEEIRFSFDDGINPDISYAYEVERKSFDNDLLEHAKTCGVDVRQPEEALKFDIRDDRVFVESNKSNYEARFVVDAGGKASSLLGNTFKVQKLDKENGRIAIFTHFENVGRKDGVEEGDILVAMLPDNAWSWVIPFKGNKTSVGVVCQVKDFKKFESAKECFYAKLKISEKLYRLCENAKQLDDFRVVSNYAHKFEKFYGPRWMLLGDAAAFIDPVFSSGVHIGLHSARLASGTLSRCLKEELTLEDDQIGARYQVEVEKGTIRFANLINLFYGSDFVPQMKSTLRLERMRKAFTSAVAGDMWNEKNFLFEKAVL